MIRSKEELANTKLDNYSAIFIGGGNTFKLLKELKESNSFNKIKEYIDNNGIIFGGSAGAIIFGYDLKSCKLDDENYVNLQDIAGFDILNSISILCHYTNRTKEKDEQSKNYLLKLSKQNKVLALPEEDTIYYNNGIFEVIGDKPYYLFELGNIIEFNSNKNKIKEYNNITSPQELMEFMDTNITYGWIDIDNKKHLNNLHNCHEKYKVSTIEETIKSGLGTCLEQAKIIKDTLDKLGYETRLYCHINDIENTQMHCFVLYKNNNNWYHFEHSNTLRKGIHQYKTLDQALSEQIKGFKNRTLTEISDIPDNLTFNEFIQYVNTFNNKKINK